MERGIFTRKEILSQPEAWAEALDVLEGLQPELLRLFGADYDQVVFTGCGSTYYLALAGAALFQEATGRLARAVPGGELLLNTDLALGKSGHKTLLVAISRSGSTTETVRAVEQFKAQERGPVIVVTNYSDQPLAALADLAIVIAKGQEESVAQTRSFASMYVATTALCLLAGGRERELKTMRGLPEAGKAVMAQYESLAQKFGENLEYDRFYFLGSGGRYGLACEVNLKMKEMTLTHSEPFHFLEFRHGPMSMVNQNAVVVGMVSEKNQPHELAVLDEMKALGGQVLAMGENEADVCFSSDIPEMARGVLYLPVLQLMAYHRSMAKGLNPDRPANLTAVVKLNF
ncbi:MAG TPA: SIS domain-containing protein [Anaerolineaceae bacterium]|nr:SIS domain-containing protein [Anaerolineaceae bacterium]HPN51976.1 SIS domain-containing protein [Anaerolineaceae bacterium]